MKSRRYDGTDVRKILSGMLTDRTVVARIASQWAAPGLFGSDWANVVGTLAVAFFEERGIAAGNAIPTVFEAWARTTTAPDETVDAVERFLRAISDEGHRDPPEYVLDLAATHFNKVKLDRLVEAARLDLDSWDVASAMARLETHTQVNLGAGAYSEPIVSVELWESAFSTERRQPLISYHEDLGDFIGDAFQRHRFFSFMAPDKTGKTAWLIDLVYRAVRAKNYVAFFDLGDGIEEDFMKRLAIRVSGESLYPATVSWPIGWKDDGMPDVTDHISDGTSYVLVYREMSRLAIDDRALRTKFVPAGSMSVDDLDSVLDEWDRTGDWRPDVVILDYADLFAPPRGIKEGLEQIDETWKRLRRLSQARHCLVLTATQASSLAYREGRVLGKRHFSGRKTKLAHVNGMLGINVTSEEKEKGVSRINWIVRREAAYNENHVCTVAGCLSVGNPAVISRGYHAND